jgi:hypothetical protein
MMTFFYVISANDTNLNSEYWYEELQFLTTNEIYLRILNELDSNYYAQNYYSYYYFDYYYMPVES